MEPPAGRGRGGFYFDSHLNRLLEIKSLQDKGLKLAAISEILTADESPKTSEEAEAWSKYTIKPGFEIHVSEGLATKDKTAISKIIRLARSILENGGQDDE